MKKVISLLMAVVMLAAIPFQSFAQATENKKLLKQGTNIIVKTNQICNSSSGSPMFIGIVDADVYDQTGQSVLIQKGTQVKLYAEIKKNGAPGKPGKIVINSASTTSVDGKTIPLTASFETQGKGKQGLAWGLGIGTGLVTLVGLCFLFIKGGDAEIPYGTAIPNVIVEGNHTISID